MIEVTQFNKKHSCLKIANIANSILALVFLVMFVLSFADHISGLKTGVWIAYTVFSLFYLLLWSGALVFLFKKLNDMVMKILPNSKLFFTMACLLFASLFFNSLSIYFLIKAGIDNNCNPDCS